MTSFSERIGAKPPPKLVQVESMSDALRNSLWNLFHNLYEDQNQYWLRVVPFIAQHFRKVPIDDLPRFDVRAMEWLKAYFFELPWHGVYDLVEFVVHNHRTMTTIRDGGYGHESTHKISAVKIVDTVNAILEQELSGYRFIQGVLTPISNPSEVQAIEAAVILASSSGLEGASLHIRAAIELLGKKPIPDFRNSIKEAISAVESVSKQIAGTDSATLDKALKDLGQKTDLHNALRAGFLNLYGYTNDEDGIRHAILDDPKVGFPEAKYMVVSCSAFVHFLIQKADAAGLLKVR